MANREHFNEYSSALDHNVEMAQATLTSIFNSFTSDMSARDIKKNLRELYPALVREYGDRAAQVALEYYESERTAYLEETNQDDDLYAPGIPNGVPLTYLRKDVSEICKHYHAKNQIENVYTALLGAASNRIMKMSDSTLAYAMKGDRLRPKWALVSRLLSCSWCSMISSFGFHYNSAYNVEKARHKPNPTACRCSVCVDFNHDDPHLKGYDPDKMYYKFSAIADKLGIDFTRENQANTTARRRILAAYEKSQRKSRKVNARITKVADSLGIKVVDGKATNAADKKLLFSELKLRDRQWLLTGKPPVVDYENELAEKNAHDHEIEQAKRLSKQGIKCTFQVDYEIDEKTKGTARQKTIGKTDLINGIELKSLSGAKNLEKHIKKELHNSKRKIGFRTCNFDATGSLFTDEEISQAIINQLKARHVKRASFIGKDGEYHVINNEA